MFKKNYHTHTFRCNHAIGTDEEYVHEAIAGGFDTLGFSDHVMLPSFSEPNVRGEYIMSQDYYDSINKLKKIYKDRIEIFLGYEAEGFSYYFPYYKEILQAGIIDYLILGNHSMMDDHHQIIARFGQPTASNMYAYKDTAIAALNTNMFSIFAHPDYFMAAVPVIDRDVIKVSKCLIEKSISLGIPLEVNVAGLRNGKRRIREIDRYIYPNKEFFKLAKKMGAQFTLGLDAHAPYQLNDDHANSLAVRFVHELDLPIIEDIEFRKGR